MFAYLTKFFKKDDGAVTVDWVVLTAIMAGFCILYVIEIKGGIAGLSASTGDFMAAQDPAAAAGGNIQGPFDQ